MEIITKARELLCTILNIAKIDRGHDITHIDAVMAHMYRALEHETLNDADRTKLLLAALLHDADDHKFFPGNAGNENARWILASVDYSDAEDVISIIRTISASSNEQLPTHLAVHKWVKLPMYCDRLEALGHVGIQRAIDYANFTGRPLYTAETKFATCEDELSKIATPERFKEYVSRGGGSVSTIDHLYDKVLHLTPSDTDNPYILAETRARMQIVIDYLLHATR